MAEFTEVIEIPTRGGRREGAGRKKGYSPKRAAELMEDDTIAAGDDTTTVASNFQKAKARKEAALADMHELKFKVESGEYVSRAAVRDAMATVLASIAQTLRSIPDNVERKLHASTDVTEELERVIDAALADAAAELSQFTTETVG